MDEYNKQLNSKNEMIRLREQEITEQSRETAKSAAFENPEYHFVINIYLYFRDEFVLWDTKLSSSFPKIDNNTDIAAFARLISLRDVDSSRNYSHVAIQSVRRNGSRYFTAIEEPKSNEFWLQSVRHELETASQTEQSDVDNDSRMMHIYVYGAQCIGKARTMIEILLDDLVLWDPSSC